jgi:hypothetical protein
MYRDTNYFQVSVEVSLEHENGKVKKHTEQYLVRASSVTDSEARLIKSFQDAGDIRDYRIKSSKETNIVEVIEE